MVVGGGVGVRVVLFYLNLENKSVLRILVTSMTTLSKDLNSTNYLN